MKRIFWIIATVMLLGSMAWAEPVEVGGTMDQSNMAITGGSITGTTLTTSDYQYVPVEAGMDSVMNAPDAAIKAQGIIGATIAPALGNVTYSTWTSNGVNMTSAGWGSGTQTGTYTINPVVVGKVYRLQFTPTVTGQVPTFTATSGITVSVIPTIVSATVENIYFRASATTAVFTVMNTGTSTWSTASTTCYEYTRPAIVREFSPTTQQTLIFDWLPPKDWNAGTITITPYMLVTQATGPAQTETIIFSFSGYAVGDSESLSQATGTAISSTTTEPTPATHIQYDEIIGTETAAITIANTPAAGKKIRLMVDRLTTDTYEQKVGLAGFLIKFTRTFAP
jgi:hypothetical protein